MWNRRFGLSISATTVASWQAKAPPAGGQDRPRHQPACPTFEYYSPLPNWNVYRSIKAWVEEVTP
jgi:hypothetical protein